MAGGDNAASNVLSASKQRDNCLRCTVVLQLMETGVDMVDNGFSLKPVSGTQSRTSDLVRMLSEDIRSGRIKPGEKLPTEQEIVRLTGVSRTVVREAV
ncbi:MAG: GntR family transcriptional regulator, partial [Proteobacteria bacterium]|nr:GntR family transcriptional regulator [Pseudomonadota bacterium]